MWESSVPERCSGQITAVDDAVKRRTQKCFIMLPEIPKVGRTWKLHCDRRRDVADAEERWRLHWKRRSVMRGDLCQRCGHLEFAYSTGGSGTWFCLRHSRGKALDLSADPAAIGFVMADLAVKAADVDIVKYMTPDEGTVIPMK